MMYLKEIWLTLFGSGEILGLARDFWLFMAAVLLIVVVMNIVFWGMKPQRTDKNAEAPK